MNVFYGSGGFLIIVNSNKFVKLSKKQDVEFYVIFISSYISLETNKELSKWMNINLKIGFCLFSVLNNNWVHIAQVDFKKWPKKTFL